MHMDVFVMSVQYECRLCMHMYVKLANFVQIVYILETLP